MIAEHEIRGSYGSDYQDYCSQGCDLSLIIVYLTMSVAIQC